MRHLRGTLRGTVLKLQDAKTQGCDGKLVIYLATPIFLFPPPVGVHNIFVRMHRCRSEPLSRPSNGKLLKNAIYFLLVLNCMLIHFISIFLHHHYCKTTEIFINKWWGLYVDVASTNGLLCRARNQNAIKWR